jgi:hypothetical protein
MHQCYPQPKLLLDYPFFEQILIMEEEMLNLRREDRLRKKRRWSIFGIRGWCGVVMARGQWLVGKSDIWRSRDS